MKEHTETKMIDCHTFELVLNNGVKYQIYCGREEIDELVELIGESNVLEVEEL